MLATGTQAIVPKARGMFSKRITQAEYEEMMRRRTVPELASMLKRHPYFGDSLATLSTVDPHRGQIEELLNMDIFRKYEALVHYDFSNDEFSDYFLEQSEMREVMKAMHLLSIGLAGSYIQQIPPYLVGKTKIDLFALGQARSFAALVEVMRQSPFYRPLRARLLIDPYLRDYPMAEAALLRQNYADIFERTERCLSGRGAKAVADLFLQQAEAYNLELLLRIKTYFPRVYTDAEVEKLVLPYTFHLSKNNLRTMIAAKTPEELLYLYRTSNAVKYAGSANPDELSAVTGRAIYKYARQVLHLTAEPHAALAAFLSLASLDRENVVNIVEGVRYGLPPEQIRSMLRY